jgi:hypothetical protein
MNSQTPGAALVVSAGPAARHVPAATACSQRPAWTARSGVGRTSAVAGPVGPAAVCRDHGILRLGAEVKAGYGLNVAPDPGSGYARKLMGCAAGPEFFMPGILRARSCRQRKGRSLRQILIRRFRTAGRRPGLAVKCSPQACRGHSDSGDRRRTVRRAGGGGVAGLGPGLRSADVLLAAVFYLVTGLGGDRRLSPAVHLPRRRRCGWCWRSRGR